MSKKSIKSDLARIDRMKDAEIDYSDIPHLDKSFFSTATEAWPPAKQQLTIRLDADVLKWLKAHGKAETVVVAALELFRGRPSLGFSDCLMLQLARKAGHLPSTGTEICPCAVTLDRADCHAFILPG